MASNATRHQSNYHGEATQPTWEKAVEIEQPSLVNINQVSDSDALIRYITSVIDKLFPIYRDDSSQNLALFGLGDSDEPYQYAPGFRPHTDTKQLDFDVTYLGRNQNDGRMVVKISWDFDCTDVNDEHQMYCPYLAEEISTMCQNLTWSKIRTFTSLLYRPSL